MSGAKDPAVDRFEGCLLGLAVGDALGTPLEFTPQHAVVPIGGMVGGGPFHLNAGQWTDDTSMALCLAESLLAVGGFDARDQLDRYVRWWRKGENSSTGVCFDIGNTTAAALHRFEQTGTTEAIPDARAAGNGSLMRLAPVPMRYAADPGTAEAMAAASSRTTHAADEPVDACRYFGRLLVDALGGAPKEALLAPPAMALVPTIAEVANGSFKHKQPPEIVGAGHVVRTLEAALWAFHTTGTFRDGALAAVNLGDDADTTGAVYGQIAGAFYRAGGIPAEWLDVLHERERIRDLARQLHAAASPLPRGSGLA